MKFVSVTVGVDGSERVRARYAPPQNTGGLSEREFMTVWLGDDLGDDLMICGDPHAVVNVLRQAADLAAEKLAEARRRETQGEAVAS